LKIAPLGADTSPFTWTEHRMVASQAPVAAPPLADEEVQAVAEALTEESKASLYESTEALKVAEAKAELAHKTPKEGIQVGDFVVVRYNDTNKLRRIFLSGTENRPEDGIVHVSQPLGQAVLGADIDDEIQFPHGKGTRSAVVERIEHAVN
jgi:transcription elongation GreA/GreB family factor